MYYVGEGVKADVAQAVTWWRKAAERGEPEAEHNLGLMYYQGKGVKQSYAKAVSYWKTAAEQGFAESQNSLGNLYYNGVYFDKDMVKAYVWFRLASTFGKPDADRSARIVAQLLGPKGTEKAEKQAHRAFDQIKARLQANAAGP